MVSVYILVLAKASIFSDSWGMKPTVLFFAPVSYFKGGAENSLQDLLHNPAIRPVLVVPAKGPLQEQAARENIAVEIVQFGAIEHIHRPLKPATVAKALLDSVKAAWKLRNYARKHRAICLHTNGMKAHMLGMMAMLMGGVPVVAHVRDIPYTKIEKIIWKTLAVGCRYVLVVSRACWPDDNLPDNVLVVPNGIAMPDVTLPKAPDCKKPLRLGFCGRIDPIKGIELLLQWMSAAKDAKQDVQLVIRGHGDEAYEQYLITLVSTMGLENRVAFEGPKKGLDKIFGELDAIVVPSRTPDPLPRSVMEAMAVGLPVMGYPAGGIPDMIVPGKSGFLVKTDADFVAAVKTLMDKKEWLALQAGGRERVASGFTLDALYGNLAKVYGSFKTNSQA